MTEASVQAIQKNPKTNTGADTIESVFDDFALFMGSIVGRVPPELADQAQTTSAGSNPSLSSANPPPTKKEVAKPAAASEQTIYLSEQERASGCDVNAQGVRYRLPGGLQPLDTVRLSNGLVFHIRSK